jgi:hypothetical protein
MGKCKISKNWKYYKYFLPRRKFLTEKASIIQIFNLENRQKYYFKTINSKISSEKIHKLRPDSPFDPLSKNLHATCCTTHLDESFAPLLVAHTLYYFNRLIFSFSFLILPSNIWRKKHITLYTHSLENLFLLLHSLFRCQQRSEKA